MKGRYDVVVIGSGPGGIGAAVTAAQWGARVAIVEKNVLGGVCVNRGCIPTKTFLNTAILYNKIREADKYGITVQGPGIDYRKMVDHIGDVTGEVRRGVEAVSKVNGIEIIKDIGRLGSKASIWVGDKEFPTDNIIIATGSRPRGLPGLPFDNKRIFSSEQFLDSLSGMDRLPDKITIAGAGYIGCEWAGILSSLGVAVTLTEKESQILPGMDHDLTRLLEKSLKQKGVAVKLNTMVIEAPKGKVIVCIGREPVTEGFEKVEKTDEGWIKVDKYMRTSLPNVYAVGDVVGPPLLAYTAQKEGEIAAGNAVKQKTAINYTRHRVIPVVVFSIPEIAVAGVEEKNNADTVTVRAYFKGLGRALADGDTEGMVKITYNKKDYRLIKVGIAGHRAGDLINEAVLVLERGLTVKEWAGRIWPHPVLSEIFGAALAKVK